MALNTGATLGVPWGGANDDCAQTPAGRLH